MGLGHDVISHYVLCIMKWHCHYNKSNYTASFEDDDDNN